MASVTKKSNGRYIIRVFCGTDEYGKKIIKSRTFVPSSKNLSFSKLHKELDFCTKIFEEECQEMIESGRFNLKASERISFPTFCEKYIEIQENNLAPEALRFYKKVIENDLMCFVLSMTFSFLKELAYMKAPQSGGYLVYSIN